MKSTQHPSEEELIEFHLQESAQEAAIRQHLEVCEGCAGVSESIAETLRVFSGDPVPEPNLEHSWQRLRGTLPPAAQVPKRGFRFSLPFWVVAGCAAAIATVAILARRPFLFPGKSQGPAVAVLQRPGPLTTAPANPQLAEQLEGAERLLTVVNHASGPLDDATRRQAHDLLLKNAVFIQTARANGDMGTAAVLDNLGRVLTNIDHESAPDDSGWHLRLEWNTRGLLLDIRILQQNDARQ